MIAPPTFASLQELESRRGDVGFWGPYVAEILRRHGLTAAGQEPAAGFNVTYPTFLHGDVVVKLFGYISSWRQSHAAEYAAYALLATDLAIAAPRLLAAGRLYDADAAWPYLITTRMAGVASWRAELSGEEWSSLAEALGRQVRRLHALRPSEGVARHEDWATVDVVEAARRSSLPPHLVAQVGDFVARLDPFGPVFIHGDLTANHVYVEGGRFVGIIDWGDALVTDRHLELIQVYRDLLGCDTALFRAFLEASDWPVGKDFPRRALGFALHRQAVGLAQHPSIDVFMPIAARFPLQGIGSLDELATVLFAI